MPRAVVTHAFRTPIGRYLGGLSSLTGVEIGTACVSGLLERSGIDPALVEQVIFGNGRQAGAGPNPARQIGVKSGIPQTAIAYTVNMACASGLKSLVFAAQEIEHGEAEVIVAGGTESMSRLPYLLPQAREGYRMGHAPIVDAMYQDGFQCPLANQLMGATAENLAEEYGLTRREQDDYALMSQRRCGEAMARGAFADEVIPVTVPGRKGDVVVATDEHPRPDSTEAGIAKLPPVFKKDGTVHAGNSSGITDGAAALLVMSEERAAALGLEVLAVVEGHAAAGVDPRRMGIGPVPATAKLAAKLGIEFADWDLVELNEAFAAQVLACFRDWKCDAEKINVNGGSIALGHPIGATGARIVVTLLHEMKRRDARRGLATLCVSGGMGQSVSLVRP